MKRKMWIDYPYFTFLLSLEDKDKFMEYSL